jgi:hypothetical protein
MNDKFVAALLAKALRLNGQNTSKHWQYREAMTVTIRHWNTL